LSKIFKTAKASSGLTTPFVLDSDVVRGLVGLETIEQERRKAMDVRRRMEMRAQAVEREAYERGFGAGEKAGLEFGKQKAAGLFQKIGEILKELGACKETVFKDMEKEIIELALALAEKIVSREINRDDKAVLNTIQRAMKVAATTGEITLKVNPADREVLFEHKEDLARYGVGVDGVRIKIDDQIARGGCLIETNYGVVDATVQGIIDELREMLDDEL
jgi:flagellar assembly protein FliH